MSINKDQIFLQYELQNSSHDLSKVYLLLNVSVKSRVKIFIHRQEEIGESLKNHTYALGDIPSHCIERISK